MKKLKIAGLLGMLFFLLIPLYGYFAGIAPINKIFSYFILLGIVTIITYLMIKMFFVKRKDTPSYLITGTLLIIGAVFLISVIYDYYIGLFSYEKIKTEVILLFLIFAVPTLLMKIFSIDKDWEKGSFSIYKFGFVIFISIIIIVLVVISLERAEIIRPLVNLLKYK